jgi:hypothetical protein
MQHSIKTLPTEILQLVLDFLPKPDLIHPTLSLDSRFIATLLEVSKLSKNWNVAANTILYVIFIMLIAERIGFRLKESH